jgi:propionyl-CoA carboxylase alpha chain
VGYTGAGTVEFLYQHGDFFFLEMNTRLQVEHPVTEMVTGLDLVRLQIEVAGGAPLTVAPKVSGHAVEARLYAEDPLKDFLPVTGTVHRFAFPDMAGLRVESGIEDGSTVTVFYDPLVAKVVAHAPTREEAAAVLASALRRAAIHGPVTNRALLVRILEHPEFLAGAIDTGFLDRHDPAGLGRPLPDPAQEGLAAVAAALSDQVFERSRSRALATIPSGWRISGDRPQRRAYRGEHGDHAIDYTATPQVAVAGLPDIAVTECTSNTVEMTRGGETLHFSIARYGEERHVDSEAGPVRLTTIPRFPQTEVPEAPGSLHAPMPGKVIRVEVTEGSAVSEGQVLLVLEAMKMEHTLRAPHTGTVVEVDCGPGDQVEAGEVLVVVQAPSESST